ncbi:type II secretion system F family protein [Halovenus sp. HT40]|uniref:type II secretion system F family protein n=1 Tax=Halovenus sp. HT40 TaxID=3126691 RepID=UPI00300E93C7
MVPLWPLPSLLGLVLVAGWLLGKFSPRVEKLLNRVSRVLFSRFVSENRTRKRRLEAAYVTNTYRTYATKTLLFVLMAFVAGSILGAYVVAIVLAVLEPLVWALAGLPDTITDPLGITTDFVLVLSSETRWLVLIVGGLALGILSATLSYVFRWQLPASTASVRGQGIEEGLPRTTAFMYALSRGGMEFPQILRTLSRNRAVYGEAAEEMNVAVREMDLFGRDMISALRRMARRTPSEQFKTFAENMTSILQSGSDLPTFFREQYERFRDEQEERQEEVLELLATIAEMYVTVLVAGTLFLITILLVFGLLVADTLMLLMLMIYLMIPLGNAAFALILQQKLDELGIARETGTNILDQLETSTPTNVSPTTSATRPDGGTVDAREANNWRMLELYDRLSRIKTWLRNPFRSFLWNPTKLLWVTVPIAAVVMLVRMPVAFQAEGVTTRILDDIVIQSALFVLISYAIVREYYKRRLNHIEAALPELLERLASLNEAGMSVVEGFERLRGSDLGVLSPEVERIWRDLEYGSNIGDALVRLGRRVRTTAVTRVVTLLTNAMRASGDMGPVLRVAAEQARAEVKLRRQRRQQMMTYLVVIYVSFFVFLLIVGAINQVLIPSLPDVVPAPSSDSVGRLPSGSTGFDQLGSVDKAAYSLVFFHGAMIQAALAGFIAGQLGEGSLRDGAKHAAIMVTIAYVFMILLTGPVASISATGVTADQNNVYGIEEVSLSEGGYIAIYDEEGVDGELLGRTDYLEPGTHSELVIPVNQELGDGQTVRIVAHQETTDNEQFDYVGPSAAGEQPVDQPYKSIGDSDHPGVEVQITRIDLQEESESSTG